MPRLKVGRLTTPVSRSPSRTQSMPRPWRSSSWLSSAATRVGAVGRLDRQAAAAVMIEAEGDVGPGHRQPLHRVEAGGIFGARAAQELAPRRHLVEQPFDPHPRAGRKRRRPLARLGAMIDLDPPAVGAARRGFRGSAATTLAIDGSASPRKPKLVTCSIASSGSLDVACRSSARPISAGLMPLPSSVTSTRSRPPADSRIATDLRAGVERVFDQFFQGAGRPLDHLARGDAIDELGGQPSY